MHVNNETGVLQPIGEIVEELRDHEAYLHVDAAQGFGKELDSLKSKRVDLISVSAHKVYGPKGVGALIARPRGFRRPPLRPLIHGGGQERGLRAGTLPVPLIVGLGEAAELSLRDHETRVRQNAVFRERLLKALEPLEPAWNGDPARTLPHVVNFSLPGLDSEAVMLALKGLVAISNGSACTSESYQPSHVLKAMGIPEEQVQGALRLSWCHATEAVDWDQVLSRLRQFA
jgi:cysteine desulfurase